MNRTLTGTAHNLGPADRIPEGEGRAFRVGGEEIAVFRSRDGRVYALQARCPHRGGPLADGLVAGSCVACPLHACSFELSTGRSHRDACGDLRTYPLILTDAGDVLVTTPF